MTGGKVYSPNEDKQCTLSETGANYRLSKYKCMYINVYARAYAAALGARRACILDTRTCVHTCVRRERVQTIDDKGPTRNPKIAVSKKGEI